MSRARASSCCRAYTSAHTHTQARTHARRARAHRLMHVYTSVPTVASGIGLALNRWNCLDWGSKRCPCIDTDGHSTAFVHIYRTRARDLVVWILWQHSFSIFAVGQACEDVPRRWRRLHARFVRACNACKHRAYRPSVRGLFTASVSSPSPTVPRAVLLFC